MSDPEETDGGAPGRKEWEPPVPAPPPKLDPGGPAPADQGNKPKTWEPPITPPAK